jgi:dTDP-4-dehydrorhamnose 3,5-epimerase
MWQCVTVVKPSIVPLHEVAGASQVVLEPAYDDRGWFRDSLRLTSLPSGQAGQFSPAQVSVSHSQRDVARGIHYSVTDTGASFFQSVTCVQGNVLDVLVDLRVGSPTFGGVYRTELSPELGVTLLMPPGIGHAFKALSDHCTLVYTMSRAYPEAQTRVIRLNGLSEDLWAVSPTEISSERDRNSPSLREAEEAGLLPVWDPTGT